ncbi:MAG: kelch repeat-containing protein [Bacteroidota bacterium]
MKKLLVLFSVFAFISLYFTNCEKAPKDAELQEIESTQQLKHYDTDVQIIYEPIANLKAASMGVWETLPDIPVKIEGGYGGIVDSLLIITAGLREVGASNATYVFDLELNTWSTMTAAPLFSSEGASVTKGGLLYCVGGQSNYLWTYNPLTDTWNTGLAPMPTRRAGLGVATVGDSLFAIGGRSLNNGPLTVGTFNPVLDVVERYDIITDTWVTVAPLPSERSDLAAVTVGGKIYVFGGCIYDAVEDTTIAVADVDVYDPNTDTWSTAPDDMPTPRGGMYAVGTKGGTVYVIGGWDGDPTFNASAGVGTIVEAYKVSQDKWTFDDKFNPMPVARGEACVASHDGSIYLIAGGQPGFGNPINSLLKFSPTKK